MCSGCGVCQKTGATNYTCSCTMGFTGRICETSVSACELAHSEVKACGNGGIFIIASLSCALTFVSAALLGTAIWVVYRKVKWVWPFIDQYSIARGSCITKQTFSENGKTQMLWRMIRLVCSWHFQNFNHCWVHPAFGRSRKTFIITTHFVN